MRHLRSMRSRRPRCGADRRYGAAVGRQKDPIGRYGAAARKLVEDKLSSRIIGQSTAALYYTRDIDHVGHRLTASCRLSG